MNEVTAQVILTLAFLLFALVFVLLDKEQLAIGLVGAVAGQGASAAVRTATNGKK